MERVRALEALFRSVQSSLGSMAEVDAWDRWGRSSSSPEQAARYAEQERVSREVYERDRPKLLAEVAALREAAPELLARWVELHVQLLDESALLEPRLASAAEHARSGWRAFASGEGTLDALLSSSAWVDPARRAELLG